MAKAKGRQQTPYTSTRQQPLDGRRHHVVSVPKCQKIAKEHKEYHKDVADSLHDRACVCRPVPSLIWFRTQIYIT